MDRGSQFKGAKSIMAGKAWWWQLPHSWASQEAERKLKAGPGITPTACLPATHFLQ